MSGETEQHSSINSLLEEADALNDELGNPLDCNSDEYQTKLRTAIAKYEQCNDLVARASMFSLNESLDDLATPDMKYYTPSLRKPALRGDVGLLTLLQVLGHPL